MALKAEAEGMTRAWKGKPALRIPVLPESISVKSMADLSNNEQGIAVGLEAESIEAVHVMPREKRRQWQLPEELDVERAQCFAE